jgi:uncharacterized protein (TIGR02466 family)
MASEFDLTPRLAWPTVFYSCAWREHPTEAPAIIEHLYRLRAAHTTSIASGVAVASKSRYGLFESPFDLFESEHPGLVKLRSFLEENLRRAIAHINASQADPDRICLTFTDSWFHITNDGGFHDAHVHNQCSWCGIYYLQAGDSASTGDDGAGNGVTRFYSPLPNGGAYSDYGNAYLSANRINIAPRDGRLVLFPSYLMHSALAYSGQTDRIVVSFNSQAALD